MLLRQGGRGPGLAVRHANGVLFMRPVSARSRTVRRGTVRSRAFRVLKRAGLCHGIFFDHMKRVTYPLPGYKSKDIPAIMPDLPCCRKGSSAIYLRRQTPRWSAFCAYTFSKANCFRPARCFWRWLCFLAYTVLPCPALLPFPVFPALVHPGAGRYAAKVLRGPVSAAAADCRRMR